MPGALNPPHSYFGIEIEERTLIKIVFKSILYTWSFGGRIVEDAYFKGADVDIDDS